MASELDEKTSVIEKLESMGVYTISLPTPFPVGPVNVFLVKQDRPILIDTGLKSQKSQALLVEKLAEHNLTLQDLGAIVVTHGHRDHMGCLGELQKETNAPVFAHPLVREQGLDIEQGGAARKQFFIDIMREFGVPAEIIEEANSLYDRFRTYWEPFAVQHELEDGGEALGYTTHYVPGHSASDTLFIEQNLGYTIVGDHILRGTNVNPLLRQPKPGETRAKSLVEYRNSLRFSRKQDLGICLPGHGSPFEGHVTAIDDTLSRQDRRSEQVIKLVREGRTTPYAISAKLFPRLENKHLHLGLSMAVGHMEVLEEQGQFRSAHEEGILHFFQR